MATKKKPAVQAREIDSDDREVIRQRLGAADREISDIMEGPLGPVVTLIDGGRYQLTADTIYYLNPPVNYDGQMPVLVLDDAGDPIGVDE